jgi:hypothetical protein
MIHGIARDAERIAATIQGRVLASTSASDLRVPEHAAV